MGFDKLENLVGVRVICFVHFQRHVAIQLFVKAVPNNSRLKQLALSSE